MCETSTEQGALAFDWTSGGDPSNRMPLWDQAPTLGGTKQPAVMTGEPMSVHENVRSETRLTPTTGALTSGGGKPGQGFPAVLEEATALRMGGDYADPYLMLDDKAMLAANPMSDRQMAVFQPEDTELYQVSHGAAAERGQSPPLMANEGPNRHGAGSWSATDTSLLVEPGQTVLGFRPTDGLENQVLEDASPTVKPDGPAVMIDMQGGKGTGRASVGRSPTLGADTQAHGVLTSSAEASHARTYRWPASVRALTESEAASGSSFIASCLSCGHDGRLSRMSPDFYPATRDATSPSSSTDWGNAGSVVSPGRYWTASTSESRNAADACSLSRVLQDAPPRRYSLSARAAAGILRRAERRGKALPPRLEAALTALASTLPDAAERTT